MSIDNPKNPPPQAIMPTLTAHKGTTLAYWTPAEDALCVWLLLICPFSDFARSHQSLQTKPVQLLQNRFKTILSDETLQYRVNAETKFDLFSYKNTPWSRHEMLCLTRLTYKLRKCHPLLFFSRFPSLFHPTRTAITMHTTNNKLNVKETTALQNQQLLFKEWISKIQREAAGKELLPFPGDYENPKQTVTNELKSQNDFTEYGHFYGGTRQQIIWTNNTLAAIIGPKGMVRKINKLNCTIGRSTLKMKPDIDIIDLTQTTCISRIHCTISFRSDAHFYLQCHGQGVIVNGIPVQRKSFVLLKDRDCFEIVGIPLVFLENIPFLSKLHPVEK